MPDGTLRGILCAGIDFQNAIKEMTARAAKSSIRDVTDVIRLAPSIAAVILALFSGPAAACIVMRDMSFGDEQLEEMDEYTSGRMAEARESFGSESLLYAEVAETRISALIHMRRWEEAVILATDILETHEVSPGHVHYPLLLIRDHLSEALFFLGRLDEAVEALRPLVELGRTTTPKAFIYPCARKLSYWLEKLGRYGEAEALRREELGMLQAKGGDAFLSDPGAMKYAARHAEPMLLSELALLVEKQGRYDEARQLYAEAVSRAQLIFGHGAPGWKVVQAYGRFLAEHGRGLEDAAALDDLKTEYPQLFPR